MITEWVTDFIVIDYQVVFCVDAVPYPPNTQAVLKWLLLPGIYFFVIIKKQLEEWHEHSFLLQYRGTEDVI